MKLDLDFVEIDFPFHRALRTFYKFLQNCDVKDITVIQEWRKTISGETYQSVE